MAIYFMNVSTTADPDVVTIKVTKGLSVTEFYDAPASVLTDDKIIMNLVRLSKIGVGLAPIKAK